jgi:hypothetical protein
LPNILGAIYGGRMRDQAIRLRKPIGLLRVGLEDELPHAMWISLDRICPGRNDQSVFDRDALRVAAGEPLIATDGIHLPLRGPWMPPLTLAEHRILGTKLKAAHEALIAG